jgi:hypothetical protein
MLFTRNYDPIFDPSNNVKTPNKKMENIILLATVASSFIFAIIATPFVVAQQVAQQFKASRS